MASFRKIGRNWFYRYVDANGKQTERKGCPDRRETESMAATVEGDVAKVRAGLIDPKALAFRTHEALSLSESEAVGSVDQWMTSTSTLPMNPNPLKRKALDASCRFLTVSDKRRGWDSNPRIRGTYQRFSRPFPPPPQVQRAQSVRVA